MNVSKLFCYFEIFDNSKIFDYFCYFGHIPKFSNFLKPYFWQILSNFKIFGIFWSYFHHFWQFLKFLIILWSYFQQFLVRFSVRFWVIFAKVKGENKTSYFRMIFDRWKNIIFDYHESWNNKNFRPTHCPSTNQWSKNLSAKLVSAILIIFQPNLQNRFSHRQTFHIEQF